MCLITPNPPTVGRTNYQLFIQDVRDWYPSCPLYYSHLIVLDYSGFQGAGKQSTATFHGWVNNDGKYSHSTQTTVDQNNGEYTDDSGGYYGTTIATANQSMAWTFVPDGDFNKTSSFIGFAMGWDGSNYNYHMVTKYLEYGILLGNESDWVTDNGGFSYRLSTTGTPPLGWIAPN